MRAPDEPAARIRHAAALTGLTSIQVDGSAALNVCSEAFRRRITIHLP